jgi:hypothetical protein
MPAGRSGVAGRQDADARLGHHRHRGDAAGRQHADFARADGHAGTQQKLAAGDVGTGMGDELAGGGGAPHLDGVVAGGLRMLDHDNGVGAARYRAAGGDGRRRAGPHGLARFDAAGDHLAIEGKLDRVAFAGGREIGRTDGKAVDIRAVEGRHVDGRGHVGGERQSECLADRHLDDGIGSREQGGLETRHGVFARQDGEKLLLVGCLAGRGGGGMGFRIGHGVSRSGQALAVAPAA